MLSTSFMLYSSLHDANLYCPPGMVLSLYPKNNSWKDVTVANPCPSDSLPVCMLRRRHMEQMPEGDAPIKGKPTYIPAKGWDHKQTCI